MQIEAVEVRTCELVLVDPLATSVAVEARRPVVLVRLLTDLGEGWGECVALAEPTYSDEHAEGALRVLLDHLLPRLFAPPPAGPAGRSDEVGPEAPGSALLGGLRLPPGLEAALAAMAPVRGHRMAKAAVEMALLDAWLSSRGVSLAHFLGASATSVPAGATVGLTGDPGRTLEAAGRAVEEGFGRVKCKVAPGQDVAPVGLVRAAYPDLVLSVDANGSYRLDEPDHERALLALDELGLAAIEQPLAPDDLVGHARLAARLSTPVVLDESVRSLGELESAAALSACDGVSVKPGPLGGLLRARAVLDRLVELGLSASVGGMLETGLARAVSLALAALPGFDLPGDLGPSSRYFRPDLTGEHRLVDGRLLVPTSPGLGRRPDPDQTAVRCRLVGVLRP